MALQVGEMLITVYWPNRTGLLLCEGAHGGAEKTTTVMITHRGALDNTQSAVTAAGHLCYAPVSHLCQQISTCHTQLQPLCVSAASATQLPLHTVQDYSCSFRKTHCKSSRGALINSHEAPHASAQLSLTSTWGKQTFQGLF